MSGFTDDGGRWRGLFGDLEGQFEAERARDEASEEADRARYECGQLSLLDRFRGAEDSILRLGVRGSDPVDGGVAEVGADWVSVGPRPIVVALHAIRWVEGLRGGRPAVGPSWAPLDLRRLLRELTQERARLTMATVDGDRWQGTPAAVYADHVDVALHDEDDRPGSGRMRSVPLGVIATVIRH